MHYRALILLQTILSFANCWGDLNNIKFDGDKILNDWKSKIEEGKNKIRDRHKQFEEEIEDKKKQIMENIGKLTKDLKDRKDEEEEEIENMKESFAYYENLIEKFQKGGKSLDGAELSTYLDDLDA